MFSNIDLSPFLGAFFMLTLFNLQGTLPQYFSRLIALSPVESAFAFPKILPVCPACFSSSLVFFSLLERSALRRRGIQYYHIAQGLSSSLFRQNYCFGYFFSLICSVFRDSRSFALRLVTLRSLSLSVELAFAPSKMLLVFDHPVFRSSLV